MVDTTVSDICYVVAQKKRLTKRSYYRKIPQTRQFVYECDSVFNRFLLATISLYLTQEPPKLWVCGLHGYRG